MSPIWLTFLLPRLSRNIITCKARVSGGKMHIISYRDTTMCIIGVASACYIGFIVFTALGCSKPTYTLKAGDDCEIAAR